MKTRARELRFGLWAATTSAVLTLLAQPCAGQIEPEVFTARRSLQQALDSNPPDLAEAMGLLVGYSDRPEHRRIMECTWRSFWSRKATGTIAERRRQMNEVCAAFDACLAAAGKDRGKESDMARQFGAQRAESFVKLVAPATSDEACKRSAAIFLDCLQRMSKGERQILHEFGKAICLEP